MMVKYVKTYIDVLARMRSDGTIIPLTVLWDDTEITIDYVLKISSQQPRRVYPSSGTIRYLCRIGNQQRELYLEDSPRRWFVEKAVLQFV